MEVRTANGLADPDRLAALRATGLLDTLPEEAFDRFTRLAAAAVGAPVSLLSFLDGERQFIKSQVGLPTATAAQRNWPLSQTLCRHVVLDAVPFVVEDAREDARLAGSPAPDDSGPIAYAGVPLVSERGHALGALCAMDPQARHWSDDDVQALLDIAAMAMSEIELRAALLRSEDRREELERAARALRTLHGALDAAGAEELAMRTEALQATADLAHELRTPLYAIRMLTEDIGAVAPPELQSDLGLIDATTSEALRVIDHQLELARANAGSGVVRVGAVRVPELLAAVRGMLEPLPRAPGVALRFEDPGRVVELETDGVKLAQVLRNLTTNAIKHTVAGEVCVAVVPAEQPGWVRFCVADTGSGIAPEDLERIFEPYERVEGKRQVPGTGLGLPLARRLARMLGGDVTVESTLGEGSRFAVELPATLREAAPGVRITPAPY